VSAHPALAVLELESLARGAVVVDALVKRAQVEIQVAEGVSTGKYVIVFVGPVAEVEEAFKAGEEIGGALVMDRLLLPQIAGEVQRALGGKTAEADRGDALGLIETQTVAAAIASADAAVKAAKVKLTSLRLARGIGGKGFYTLAGVQHDVEAAIQAAGAAIAPHLLIASELIQRPHADARGEGLASKPR
jgi:microcompartment protein CcmL/EutN